MNKQSGRIGLYLVLIVALIAGYLYLNNQVAVQSDYTYGQLKQAVTDGKVTSATIHQNSEVPTGSVIVNISGEGQKRIYVADVNEAEQLLRESGLDPAVEDVPKQSVFMNSVFPVLLTCGLIICRIWSLFTPFPLSLPEWEQPAIPCLFQRMTKYLILRVKCSRILPHFLEDVWQRS